MPVATSYPGVYIEELPSSVRTIAGVATSIAVFIGWAPQGPTKAATRVLSWSDYNKQFGGLDAHSYLGYAVSHFFTNGGQEAWIVRLVNASNSANVVLGTSPTLTLTANSPGEWAKQYWIGIKNQTATYVGTVTHGSNIIRNLNSTSGILSGGGVSGPMISPNTTVKDVGTNSVTLSAPADLTNTTSITFAPTSGQVITQSGTLTFGNAIISNLDNTTGITAGTKVSVASVNGLPTLPANTTVQSILGIVTLSAAAGTDSPGPITFTAPDNTKINATGTIKSNSNKISDLASDAPIPKGSKITSPSITPNVSDYTSNSVQLSQTAVLTNTTSITFTPTGAQPVIVTGAITFAITSGTTLISGLNATTGITVGSAVSGPMIPTGTSVFAVDTNTVTLSNAVMITSTGAITFSLNNGRFRLQVISAPQGATSFPVVESFDNLSITKPDPQGRFVEDVINNSSNLITAAVGSLTNPAATPVPPPDTPPLIASQPLPTPSSRLSGGDNDVPLTVNSSDFENAMANALALPGSSSSVNLLDQVDLFNLLCVPGETNPTILSQLHSYCVTRRAFLIADAPQSTSFDDPGLQSTPAAISGGNSNAAVYFPWIQAPDPLAQNVPRAFPPCGFVAGICAKTDVNRGVWKAPAGTETGLTGASGVDVQLTDAQNGVLNPLAVNCLRNFKVYGTVVWGARTVQGNDEIGSQWKYVPVRRLALFLEESLFRALKWVVFEPNDEPLWSQIRLNVGAFMQTLYRQGAFQGTTPKQAYFVKCDSETTTSTDQNNGVVNIVVGFAPLKPAEFVIIQIQQMTGQQ